MLPMMAISLNRSSSSLVLTESLPAYAFGDAEFNELVNRDANIILRSN